MNDIINYIKEDFSMYELINEKFVEIKEYKGQRVVTFRDIDTLHKRPNGTARKRFNDNRKYFIENVDYFIINQPSEIRTLGFERPQGGLPEFIILITETGYLILVKSFRDELSWAVQRQLVNTYFRSKQLQQYNINQSEIIMAVKKLYENNYELNEKIYSLKKENHELNKKIKIKKIQIYIKFLVYKKTGNFFVNSYCIWSLFVVLY